MKKIISLFERNYDGDRLVNENIVRGAEWVINGEGIATRKWDGTCCMVRDGKLYKRYDAKKGRTPPVDFEPAQEPDEITGHQPGWIPCKENEPSDRWHLEAFAKLEPMIDGTYELVGEKAQGNPEKIVGHKLIPHGKNIVDAPRTFLELKEWFRNIDIEGVVWHNADGRMVKIKKKDFGLKRV